MKLNLPIIFCAAFSMILAMGSVATAQELKIAVIDMQAALNDYNRTKVEVEKINALADEKRQNIDERQAAYQKMTSQMNELKKKVEDTSLSKEVREEALKQLNTLAQERAAKGNEITDAQRKASAEIVKARQEMEATLVQDIKAALTTIVEAQALDLVFDKSFLPKANKAILYTSANVKDLTAETVAALNANPPATTSSTGGE